MPHVNAIFALTYRKVREDPAISDLRVRGRLVWRMILSSNGPTWEHIDGRACVLPSFPWLRCAVYRGHASESARPRWCVIERTTGLALQRGDTIADAIARSDAFLVNKGLDSAVAKILSTRRDQPLHPELNVMFDGPRLHTVYGTRAELDRFVTTLQRLDQPIALLDRRPLTSKQARLYPPR